MNLILALFVVVSFAAALEYLDLPDHVRAVVNRSRDALEVLQDESSTDREKEEALQQHSKHLFQLLGILVGGSALALGLPFGAVWLLGKVGVGSFWDTIDVLERIDFLAGVTVVGLLGYLAFQHLYRAA